MSAPVASRSSMLPGWAAVLSAVTVADAVNASEASALYVVGGGAHNPLLMDDLGELCHAELVPAEQSGVDVDYLEAMAFGWFASCYLSGRAVVPPSVTGASAPAVLGALYPAS